MEVSINGGSPKSSILVGFSFINHPFWGASIHGKRSKAAKCEAKHKT
jgi:hypothetical protein